MLGLQRELPDELSEGHMFSIKIMVVNSMFFLGFTAYLLRSASYVAKLLKLTFLDKAFDYGASGGVTNFPVGKCRICITANSEIAMGC